MSVTNVVNKEEFRKLLTSGKPFSEIMTDIMKIGQKLVSEVGHREYASFEEAMADLKNNSSPLFVIDEDVTTDFEDVGTNLIGVKKCPFRDIMAEMSQSGTSDADVDTVMDGFQTHDGVNNRFSDLGCYVAQQLRQMILSSLKINGEYLMNYVHLGCSKANKERVINTDEVSAVGIELPVLNRLLDEVDCVYAISFREGMEE